jgi:glycosyltransferase involved in cell wall biosynthesis
VSHVPKLAVIITCYNYRDFVDEAIESVLLQGRDDCELVVVDDGSTDNSWEAISRWGVTAYRIENGGQLAACLYGLDRTCAPFVLFLDADDKLKPGALDVLVDRLDPEIAKLQFALSPIDAEGRPLAAHGPEIDAFRGRERLFERVLKSGVYKTPPTSGNVFRRDLCALLREVDYDRAVDGVILFAAPVFGDVLSLSEELGCYRIHGRNDSGVGARPATATLERDLARFVARSDHLSEIVRRTTGRRTVEASEAFYYQERRFYLDVISRRRPTWRQLRRLVKATLREDGLTLRGKLALAGFLFALATLPRALAISLVSYRLQAGRRSAAGLLRHAFASQP